MGEKVQQHAEPYPFSTLLEADGSGRDPGGYSIFLLALRHRIYLRQSPFFDVGYQKRLREHLSGWCSTAEEFHWGLHPYLSEGSGRDGWDRSFNPSRVLCKSAQENLLGCSFLKGNAEDSENQLIRARLDAKDFACPREEPILLSLARDEVPLFRQPLRVCTQVAGERAFFGFRVDWADLWLFPDSHALNPLCNAILACKVVPTEVEEGSGQFRPYRVGDLAVLNRLLRDLDLESGGGAWLASDSGSERAEHFWGGAFRHWLGIELEQDGGQVVVGSSCAHGEKENLLRLRAKDRVWSDRHSDYVKVLTVAQIAEPSCESGWGCRQVDLSLSPSRLQGERAHGVWSPEQTTWLQSEAIGYPILGDSLLYELASTSNEGAALGLDGTRGFQVSKDYLRQLFSRSSIEIWEYWRGLVLRDTCAFIAWHPDMPILRQAEERYYALYLHFYYCQLRLHDLSEDIVEHELTDLQRTRETRHALMQFRNQFWFHETAIGFQGLAVADAMRAGMALDALYESVSSEIDHISRYIDEQASAGRQRMIAFVLVMIYPVAFLWDLNKEPIESSLRNVSPLWLLVLTAAAFLVVATFFIRFGTRVMRWTGRLADRLRRQGW